MSSVSTKFLNVFLALAMTISSVVGQGAQVQLVDQFNTYLDTNFPSPVSTRQGAEDLAQFFLLQTRQASKTQGLIALRDIREALAIYVVQHQNDPNLGFKLRTFSEALIERAETIKSRRQGIGVALTFVGTIGSFALMDQLTGGRGDAGFIDGLTALVTAFVGWGINTTLTQGREEVIGAINELNKPYAKCTFLLGENNL